ncbi:MAG: phosphopentomutase [Bacilli bacterium]|nr:phosphopentomutase [Bacilli bacterium]
MKFKRIFVLILDSLGVGEAQDADKYGDNGCNTLKHIMEKYDLYIPNLEKLGFLNTLTLEDKENVDAYFTIAKPTNIGKDSLTGHYEIVGIKNEVPFRTFSESGFPISLIDKIEQATGKRVIGNKVGNGEEIINELGDRHMAYGSLIVYTSADSTLQVAAHEDIVPISKLHTFCEKIRKITMDEDLQIARVIARPFNGKNGKYKFINSDRVDFAVKPPAKSILNSLEDKDLSVISIGKIASIFDGEGITKIIKGSKNNIDTINKLTDIMEKNFTGLCLTNLSDFDTLYGHNRDVEGYGKAIEDLDVEIPMILNKLNNDDLFIITADHGNDPTFSGNAHTRENVPVIIYGRNFKEPSKLEPLESMADIAATIAENFEIDAPVIGKSFLELLK